jgi:hypothetical protein
MSQVCGGREPQSLGDIWSATILAQAPPAYEDYSLNRGGKAQYLLCCGPSGTEAATMLKKGRFPMEEWGR